ncbi:MULTISPECIES: phage holin family protein [unclassified Ornithinimicrobium]|uniref:phage holin family protein n=1 Tax=unclassified Ornithinimicrobium TaxID=2615080 RepID=UPI003851834B
MRMLLSIVANGLALWAAAWLLDGITFGGEGTSLILTVLGVAVIFGVLNAIVRPVLLVLSLPLVLLTLGLFLFVLNALMLSLTSWLAGVLGLEFHVDTFFWDAVLGAMIISVVGLVLDMVTPHRAERLR